MAKVAGAFVVPHDPLMFTSPDALGVKRREHVDNCYATVAKRLNQLAADTVIVVGADHYIMFGPDCLPQYLMGIGDVEGPIDRLPGLTKGNIPNDQELAQFIRSEGSREGYDWAVANSLVVDHSVMVPWQLCIQPAGDLKVIPIYLASGVEPLVPKQRAYDLGAAAARAVHKFPKSRNVALIGSGGISHWVGMAEMGKVNTAFDTWVLEQVISGNEKALISLSDEDIIRQGGNGALEIRSFLFAMGFTGGRSGCAIGYEPAPEWITGLGFAELYKT